MIRPDFNEPILREQRWHLWPPAGHRVEKLLHFHVAKSDVHEFGWRFLREGHDSKVRIFCNQDQTFGPGVFPKLRVRPRGSEVVSENAIAGGPQREPARQVRVDEISSHVQAAV